MADLEDYANVSIVQLLPNSADPDGGNRPPKGLLGARIVNFGTGHLDVEGGGLIIDYVPPEPEANVERVVFAFNECGMWVKWTSSLESNPDATR